MTHLYFKDDFIAGHKFNKCFYYEEDKSTSNKYEICSRKLGIKTLIVDKNKLKDIKSFNCKEEKLIRVSRNIFLTKKKEVDFCYLK